MDRREMAQSRKARFVIARETDLDVLRADPAFASILAEGWNETHHETETVGERIWVTIFFTRPTPAP